MKTRTNGIPGLESWMYNDIDCQFVICETCFWSATVFKSAEQQERRLSFTLVLYVQVTIFL